MRKLLLLLPIAVLLTLVPTLHALPGAGKAARETAEFIAAKWGREAAGEGLETSVRALIRTHGDEIVPLLRHHGPDLIRVASRHGDDAIPLIHRFGDDGMEVLLRSGDEVMDQVRRFGDDAMEIAIRHPGVGERLVAELGEDGIRLGKTLSTEETIQTLRLLPVLKKEGGVEPFVKAVDRYGSAVFTYIGRHPEVALGGAALALLLAKPEIVVEAIETAGTAIGRGAHAAGTEAIGDNWLPWTAIFLLLISAIYAAPRFLAVWLKHRRPANK